MNYLTKLGKYIYKRIKTILSFVQQRLSPPYFIGRVLLSIKHQFYYYEHTHLVRYMKDTKVAYLSVPKVGCTSVKAGLLATIGIMEEKRTHMVFRGQSLISVSCPNDYFVFTFVRNPFSRLVSCYKNRIASNTHFIDMRTYLFGYMIKSKNFSDFVRRIDSIPEWLHEPHFALQYNIIYKRKLAGKSQSERLPDFVGKFERFEEDWKFLQEKFNLADLPHQNATKKDNWRDYYDEKTAKLVYKIYKKDFETFGYEDEYKKLLKYINEKNN